MHYQKLQSEKQLQKVVVSRIQFTPILASKVITKAICSHGHQEYISFLLRTHASATAVVLLTLTFTFLF